MKKVLTTLLILAIVLGLSGCGAKLESGVVIGKKYEPATTLIQYMMVGKVIIPNYIYVPEKYKILVQGTDEEGNVNTEWWELDIVEYSRICVGMEVNRETSA